MSQTLYAAFSSLGTLSKIHNTFFGEDTALCHAVQKLVHPARFPRFSTNLCLYSLLNIADGQPRNLSSFTFQGGIEQKNW